MVATQKFMRQNGHHTETHNEETSLQGKSLQRIVASRTIQRYDHSLLQGFGVMIFLVVTARHKKDPKNWLCLQVFRRTRCAAPATNCHSRTPPLRASLLRYRWSTPEVTWACKWNEIILFERAAHCKILLSYVATCFGCQGFRHITRVVSCPVASTLLFS